MQTALADFIRHTPQGIEADAILRSCVHCGFCNATCPTYQILGDELDGPRGRIYLIKEMLEGRTVSRRTLTHLDRCLSCRNCETTCPSGVRYGRLVDIGRELIEPRVERPWFERLQRWALRKTIPYPARFTPLLRFGQVLRPCCHPPSSVPCHRASRSFHGRRRRMHERCWCLRAVFNLPWRPASTPPPRVCWTSSAFRSLSPPTPAAAERCIITLPDPAGALDFARRNIDAWWSRIEAGAEAIVMTASGCGVHVKDYGHLLQHDSAYAEKARRVSALTRDISEILTKENLSVLKPAHAGVKLAFHAPCTLQHGQKLHGMVEKILRDAGFTLTPVPDAHLCCGSAGTYSLLQPALARRLRENKIQSLQSGAPDLMVTANIGCLAHLQSGSGQPLRHWIEVMDGSAGR